MNLEHAKLELVSRYRYIMGNAHLILAPFLCEQTEEEFLQCKDKMMREYGYQITVPLIYLDFDKLDTIVPVLEAFLLSDKRLEESILYRRIKTKLKDKEYISKVINGLALEEKKNSGKILYRSFINGLVILDMVWDYIMRQDINSNNRRIKLYVLDQYYKLFRYRNNGITYKNGRDLDLRDRDSLMVGLNNNAFHREQKEIGTFLNPFIIAIANYPPHKENESIFTEEEKHRIYLMCHDELTRGFQKKIRTRNVSNQFTNKLSWDNTVFQKKY